MWIFKVYFMQIICSFICRASLRAVPFKITYTAGTEKKVSVSILGNSNVFDSISGSLYFNFSCTIHKKMYAQW